MKIGGYNQVYTKQEPITKSKSEAEKPTQEDLEALKKEISGIFGKNSYKQSSKYLNISDGAYEKMLVDPEFKNEMLTMLRTEKQYTGNALITTTITEEGWSSHNYASVSKEHMNLLEGILPEYMKIDSSDEDKEDDKDTSIKDKKISIKDKSQYEYTLQEIIKRNLLEKNNEGENSSQN